MIQICVHYNYTCGRKSRAVFMLKGFSFTLFFCVSAFFILLEFGIVLNKNNKIVKVVEQRSTWLLSLSYNIHSEELAYVPVWCLKPWVFVSFGWYHVLSVYCSVHALLGNVSSCVLVFVFLVWHRALKMRHWLWIKQKYSSSNNVPFFLNHTITNTGDYLIIFFKQTLLQYTQVRSTFVVKMFEKYSG